MSSNVDEDARGVVTYESFSNFTVLMSPLGMRSNRVSPSSIVVLESPDGDGDDACVLFVDMSPCS